MNTPEFGRLPEAEVKEPLVMDQPSTVSRAMLTKMDEIIDRLNAIAAAIEASTNGDTLQSGLDVADIKAEVSKLKFFI